MHVMDADFEKLIFALQTQFLEGFMWSVFKPCLIQDNIYYEQFRISVLHYTKYLFS